MYLLFYQSDKCECNIAVTISVSHALEQVWYLWGLRMYKDTLQVNRDHVVQKFDEQNFHELIVGLGFIGEALGKAILDICTLNICATCLSAAKIIIIGICMVLLICRCLFHQYTSSSRWYQCIVN